jgi:anti-anti-sigma factor
MVGLTAPYEYFRAFVVGEGEDRVVVAKGEIDLHTAPLLSKEVAELVGCGLEPVVIDLAGVTFLDSSGVEVLVRLHDALGRRPEALVLRQPSSTVCRVLEMAGVEALFTFRSG